MSEVFIILQLLKTTFASKKKFILVKARKKINKLTF